MEFVYHCTLVFSFVIIRRCWPSVPVFWQDHHLRPWGSTLKSSRPTLKWALFWNDMLDMGYLALRKTGFMDSLQKLYSTYVVETIIANANSITILWNYCLFWGLFAKKTAFFFCFLELMALGWRADHFHWEHRLDCMHRGGGGIARTLC